MTNYYTIESSSIVPSAPSAPNSGEAHFVLRLDPTCPVYKGHFPTHPIAPGACSLEMIRQCASIALKEEVRFLNIKQCKYLLPLEPNIHTRLDLTLTWNTETLSALMMWQEQIAIKLKVSRV